MTAITAALLIGLGVAHRALANVLQVLQPHCYACRAVSCGATPPAWSLLNKDAGGCSGLLADTHGAYYERPCSVRINLWKCTESDAPVALEELKGTWIRSHEEEEEDAISRKDSS